MRSLFVVILLVCSCTGRAASPADAGHGTDDVAPAPDSDSPDLGSARRWTAAPDDTAAAIDAKIAQAVADQGLPGIAMGVAWAQSRTAYAGAAGFSRVESTEAWTPERSFRIGSVTKTFTAAIVYQLESEGALALDDPIDDWVPGYYDGLGVTIAHLLAHTSGIPSYNYVGSFDDTRPWTPTELVQWAVDHEPALHFEPGSEWEYSNTNYVLLGLIIEAATQHTYAEEVARRLTGPLGLTHTYVAASGDDNPDIVDCYDEAGNNVTGVADPSFGWAAGAIVSTPSDLARWGAALFGGSVVSPENLAVMTTATVLADGSSPEYGMGAFVERDGSDALYGHTGGIGGYQTYMYFWEADQIALVVMVNKLGGNLRDIAGYGWAVPLGLEYP